ncbi:hypothetical protein PVK06_029858 [Gossypium arboreum]|uniref:Secreted protein n=1 Tax=Gossypium arboreum TaxID=29729 RepID=A0ABR0NLQ8_GOSAR|nr:hypothetical protein PVK06_029858 [Gossypium arboreum]
MKPRLIVIAGHVVIGHAVLSILGIDILGGLHTYWTRVWVACGACSPFCELHGCMRAETVAFPRSLRVGSVALRYELSPWLYLAS